MDGQHLKDGFAWELPFAWGEITGGYHYLYLPNPVAG